MQKISEVVVAVDGSESALRAAAFAVDLAGSLDAPLTLLYVFPASPTDSAWMAALTEEELRQTREQTGQTVLREVRAALDLPDSAAHGLVLSGDPASEIIDYQAEDPGRMVVMGRRGRSGLGSLLLGSVSDKVVRHAGGLSPWYLDPDQRPRLLRRAQWIRKREENDCSSNVRSN